jgi:hypothetical protein
MRAWREQAEDAPSDRQATIPNLTSLWSQDLLADKSGLHRAHIGEVERGESNFTIQTLKILADTLEVRIVDLVKGL